ncbi:MAG: hypothetical protein MK078_06895 [Crocinitomicaceae bacterium]|nr:hypothetical protein [Crocinitomicaceae bacterium]
MFKRLIKWCFYALIIFVLLLFVSEFIPYGNTNYSYLDFFRIKASRIIEKSSFKGQNPNDLLNQEVVDSLDIPFYSVSFDDDVQDYFNDLWKGYEEGFDGVTYSEKGQEYYIENRKWQKAMITTPSGTFKVKIRSHGKLPDNHHYGENFSFQVKGDELKEYYRVSKLRFIIYQRIKEKNDHLVFMEENFQLLRAKRNEMVKVSMNGNLEHLYFLEFNDLATSNQSNNKILQEVGVHKSGISAMSNDVDIDKDELNNIRFKDEYMQFQKAIDENNSEYVLSVSEEEYLLNYFAVKAIYGFSGHECYPANFHMYLDTITMKFYPAISREPVFNPLYNKDDLKDALITYNHAVLDRSSTVLSYYKAVLSNSTFFSKLKAHLSSIIKEKSKAIISNWNENIERHKLYWQQSFLWYSLYPEKSLESIEDNLDWISEQLAD